MRTLIPLLQRCYLPSSVIGGLLMQKLAQRVRVHQLIDHGQMQSVSGAALYDAMLRLLSAPALRSRLGLAARARMESRFNRRYVWRELQRFYAGLLQ